MMGLYRFLLAQTVLLSHFGGVSSEASRVAVYSFFTISGFLIFRVLDTKYMQPSGAGVEVFFINRILRLFPMYMVLLLITIILSQLYTNGFDNGPDQPRLYILHLVSTKNLSDSLLDAMFFIPKFDFSGHLPVVMAAAHGSILPQIWSVGIELYCYLCAPLIMIFAKDNGLRWLAVISILLIYFIALLIMPHPKLALEDSVYKNFFPALFMFVMGGGIWQLKKRTTYKLEGVLAFFVIGFYFWFLFFWSNNRFFGYEFTQLKFFLDVIFSIPVTILVVFTDIDGTLKKIADILGDLSYGIYLNQYIIAFLMMLTNEFFAKKLNWSSIFGAGYNRLEFGIHAAVFSAIFAYITYITIEKYVEKLRKRISSSKVNSRKEQFVLCH